MKITIGTRGSKLALWQAYFIEEKLKNAGAEVEIKIIETKGDKILDVALSKIGSKGVFTEELELQLANKQIDIAIHSAKDLQSDLGDNFEIIAFTEREKINDVVLSSVPQHQLSSGKKIIIGTSSTRRIAMLKAYYPHAQVVDMRGNLQTRIAKMERGDCDALLLAYAGVHRMNYDALISEILPENTFTPAVGQGTVAVECAKDLSLEKKEFVKTVCNDPETEQCLLAERTFLKIINGGCSIPVFGNTKFINNQYTMTAGIISLDGKQIISIKKQHHDPIELGSSIAKELLAKGADKILAAIRDSIK